MRKRLYRSRNDRMLFGVAGGFAEYLDVDPAFVRIVWALLIFAAGSGFLLYIVAAILIPEEPLGGAMAADPAAPAGSPGAASAQPNTTSWSAAGGHRREGNGALILGGFLVLLGVWFFARDLLPAFDDRFVLPAFLVLLGAFLVLGSMRRR